MSHTRDLTQYILETSPYHLWRENQQYPGLYVSFSKNHYVSANNKDRISALSKATTPEHVIELHASVAALIKDKIKSEWIDKSGLPIHFIDTDEVENINERNVVYIFTTSDPKLLTHAAEINGMTIVTPNLHAPNHCAEKTIIFTNRALISDSINLITPYHINNILHEFGHAIGLKHPLRYAANDSGPFAKLDCEETVMTYNQDCKKPWNAISEKFSHLSEQEILAAEAEVNAAFQAAFPDTIGTVDIEAAKLIAKQWRDRDSKQAFHPDKDESVSFQNATSTRSILQSIRHYTNLKINKGIDAIADYVTDTVSNCPTYFPPSNPNLWRNGSSPTLFCSPAILETPSLQLGNFNTLNLNK